jgi:uncharacterized protein
MRGNFVWHELTTTDTQGAGAFYPKVTGWKTQAWEQDSSYTLLMGKSAPVGGLMAQPDADKAAGTRPGWLVYIGTPDIGGTLAHAQRLGAQVQQDVQESPTVGKWAVLKDPQGATFGVLQSANPPMSSGKPGPGDFSWHELAVRDHRAAFEFYSQLFGWKKSTSVDMGQMGIYQIFSQGGQDVGGMMDRAPGSMPPDWPNWLGYVNVPDADAAARAAQAAGARLMNLMDVPGGDRIAHFIDPQGVPFAVHAYGKAAAKPASQPKAASQSKPAQSRPAAASASSSGSGSRAGATAASKPAAASKPRKAAKRRSAASKAAGAKRSAATARKRGARKSAARKGAAKKSAKKGAAKSRARRASTKRRASARRPARRPRRGK